MSKSEILWHFLHPCCCVIWYCHCRGLIGDYIGEISWVQLSIIHRNCLYQDSLAFSSYNLSPSSPWCFPSFKYTVCTVHISTGLWKILPNSIFLEVFFLSEADKIFKKRYVLGWVYICLWVPMEAKSIGSFETWLTGNCELSDVGDRKRTQVLCKSSMGS